MNKTIPSKKWLATGALAALVTFGGAPAHAADDVFALQNALYGAGYRIDSADGQMGPSTQSALEAFQKDHAGLKVTGKLDQATKEALGMVSVQVAKADVAKPTPAPAKQAKKADEPKPAATDDESGDAVEEDDDGGWLFF
ncbi:peptidoglycan-binding protein [Marinobacter halodurans]|uniref:Peptidoglycan-binding protein n=1 Tax=Marinobacter halodurans TaxID=2528979 RepID=A0ABY1ZNA4_9GAMM|nr:peptidoglycan-binding domain-containing protein [Marinobacter halodurans]TBW56224.1 peptidoglycan-binding protein [Marinobacter halodurans]